MIGDMKRCSRCGETKPIVEFSLTHGKPHTYCRPCHREYNREWREANPWKMQAAKRRWRQEHPEEVKAYRRKSYEAKKERERETTREWRAANPDKVKETAARRRVKVKAQRLDMYYRHRLAPEDYDRILAEQNNACALCRKSFAELSARIDHCHNSTLVRGVLCSWCNARLGWYENHVAEIAEYLANNPAKRLGIVARSKSRSSRRPQTA